MTTSTSEIYECLVSLLNRCPQTIEIIPCDDSTLLHTHGLNHIGSDPSLFPFLFVEENLGVPQKVLYKVYLHAIGVFKLTRARAATATVQRSHELDTSLGRVLTASSSIILLANPSHQTALNARKHLVRTHLIDPSDELRFMGSLLSSQHCAKHAELWYHRRWLLSTVYVSPYTVNVGSHPCLQFTSRGALQRELDLISRACELYPRNYFAWTHRLTCMRNLLSEYLSGTDTVDFGSVFRDEIITIKGWIDHHVSDCSAVHYVLALSQAALQSGESSLIDIVVKSDLPDHAISLVQEYPTHEALWVYVRSALSILDLWKARKSQEFTEHFVQPLAQSRCLKTGTEDNLVVASKFARHFLDNWEASVTSLKPGSLAFLS